MTDDADTHVDSINEKQEKSSSSLNDDDDEMGHQTHEELRNIMGSPASTVGVTHEGHSGEMPINLLESSVIPTVAQQTLLFSPPRGDEATRCESTDKGQSFLNPCSPVQYNALHTSDNDENVDLRNNTLESLFEYMAPMTTITTTISDEQQLTSQQQQQQTVAENDNSAIQNLDVNTMQQQIMPYNSFAFHQEMELHCQEEEENNRLKLRGSELIERRCLASCYSQKKVDFLIENEWCSRVVVEKCEDSEWNILRKTSEKQWSEKLTNRRDKVSSNELKLTGDVHDSTPQSPSLFPCNDAAAADVVASNVRLEIIPQDSDNSVSSSLCLEPEPCFPYPNPVSSVGIQPTGGSDGGGTLSNTSPGFVKPCDKSSGISIAEQKSNYENGDSTPQPLAVSTMDNNKNDDDADPLINDNPVIDSPPSLHDTSSEHMYMEIVQAAKEVHHFQWQPITTHYFLNARQLLNFVLLVFIFCLWILAVKEFLDAEEVDTWPVPWRKR
jgi:hypothetical protein